MVCEQERVLRDGNFCCISFNSKKRLEQYYQIPAATIYTYIYKTPIDTKK